MLVSNKGLPGSGLNLNSSQSGISKQSLNSNFAGKLREAAKESALLAQRAVGSVSSLVPGAAILSAGLGTAANNLSPDALSNPSLPIQNTAGGIVGDRGDFLQSMQDLQQNMMSTNMQMLSVQRKFQQMSEYYLTASNILKTKHDTDKNSINNIR